MKEYGLRQFYDNAKEGGLGAALKYDFNKTLERHPNIAKKGGIALLTLALAGPVYAGNGGNFSGGIDTNPNPHGRSTKDQTAGLTVDEQMEKYGVARGLVTGIPGTYWLRFPAKTVVGGGKTLTVVLESLFTLNPKKLFNYFVGGAKNAWDNKLETVLDAGTGKVISHNARMDRRGPSVTKKTPDQWVD